MEKNEKLAPEIQASLDRLLELLRENETMIAYQQVAEKIAQHEELQSMMDAIKAAQKEAVGFQHYGQIEAARVANQKVDQLTTEFEEHPLVVRYREVLQEANELLQFVTKKLEAEVNQRVELSLEDLF